MRSRTGLKSVIVRSKNSFATVSYPSFWMHVVSPLIDHQPVSSFGEIVATRLRLGWFCLTHFQKAVVSGGDGKLWKVSGFFGLTRPSAYARGSFRRRPPF